MSRIPTFHSLNTSEVRFAVLNREVHLITSESGQQNTLNPNILCLLTIRKEQTIGLLFSYSANTIVKETTKSSRLFSRFAWGQF